MEVNDPKMSEELRVCRNTGLPYSWSEIEWTPSIMRGWVHYGCCPICDEAFTLEGNWVGGDPTWGGRRVRTSASR